MPQDSNWPLKASAAGKTLVQIDGAYLSSAAHHLGFSVDYKALLNLFRMHHHLLRAAFYVTLESEADHNRWRPLLDWLSYNGFMVKCVEPGTAERSSIRSRASHHHVQLAVDAVAIARSYSNLSLFAGSGDLVPVLRATKDLGIRTTVIASLQPGPWEIADALRRQADEFVDLSEIAAVLALRRNLATVDATKELIAGNQTK